MAFDGCNPYLLCGRCCHDDSYTSHQQRISICRIRDNVERLEADSWCKRRSCNRWPLCPCEASSVFRTFYCNDRDVNSMADNHNSSDVSCTCLCLLPSIKKRRKRHD